MNKKFAGVLLGLFMIIAAAPKANAAVTLLDKDEWKFLFGGFVELDMFDDSTRSLTEVTGSAPIDRVGTVAGDNGRLQSSIRNSRFSFTVLPPVQDDWKTKGYLELDFLGYDPSAGAGSTTGSVSPGNSESSFYINATTRVRHAYLSAEKNGLQFLVGQTWTLFGWEPTYLQTSVSVSPNTGQIYERATQVAALKTFQLNDDDKLVAGVSVARPSQRDTQVPNVDAGVKFSMGGRRAGWSSYTSDINAEPMSVALSGTYRTFETPGAGATSTDRRFFSGGAYAVDTLIPILASADGKQTSNTLIFEGEYSTGSGYGDQFPSWTGNLSQTATATATPTLPNLDAGQGGFDGSGNFQLVKLQTWNASLQYHLPEDWHSFVDVGFAELYSSNVGSLAATKTQYDQSRAYYANVFHDFTKQIRAGAEVAKFTTRYVDTMLTEDMRYQVSAYFRF